MIWNCKLCGNCAFPQNFHTRKLSEVPVFFAAICKRFSTWFFVKCEIPIDSAALTKKKEKKRKKITVINSIAAVTWKTINNARANFLGKFIFKMNLVDIGDSKWFLIYNMIMFLPLNYWDVFRFLTTYSQELGKLKLLWSSK